MLVLYQNNTCDGLVTDCSLSSKGGGHCSFGKKPACKARHNVCDDTLLKIRSHASYFQSSRRDIRFILLRRNFAFRKINVCQERSLARGFAAYHRYVQFPHASF